MAQVACIKCHAQYEEKEQEAYYCPNCLKEKKSIADELDKKFKPREPEKRKVRIEDLPRIPGTNYIDHKYIL